MAALSLIDSADFTGQTKKMMVLMAIPAHAVYSITEIRTIFDGWIPESNLEPLPVSPDILCTSRLNCPHRSELHLELRTNSRIHELKEKVIKEESDIFFFFECATHSTYTGYGEGNLNAWSIQYTYTYLVYTDLRWPADGQVSVWSFLDEFGSHSSTPE